MSANDHLPTQEDYADPVTIEEEIELEEDGTAGSDDDMDVGDGDGEGDGEGEEEDGETSGGMQVDESIPDDSAVRFHGHTDSVYSVDINPADEDIVITGGGDDRAFLWHVSDPSAFVELAGHTDTVTKVAFSADGKLAATGGMDGLVKVWDVNSGALVTDLDGPDEIVWLTWHPRGNIVLAGANDGSAWMWGAKGMLMNVFNKHNGPTTCGSFSPDGKLVVTTSEDGSMILWDPKTATRVHKLSKEDDGRFHDGAILSLAINFDNTLALTGGDDHRAILSHLGTGKIITIFETHGASVETVSFSPTMNLAATGGMDGKLCIWDLTNLRLRHTLQHDDGVVKVVWYPNEPYLVSASADKSVRLWDVRNGLLLRKFTGHQDVLMDLALSKSGKRIVSGGDDQVVRVFQL